ncbi:F5/8 type C domain-containing protein [Lutibacter agarilyticus]|uniref:F5/8 type C domain-containing protein n=1 Tax=Lutibacter agarilyticus TaxID=1109740 RepID=A0A238Y5U4_9FLAO|nr:glycosyl hydrolase [Lutibacter agarilyticus]SNR65954.1 F5/8 type C domain-containing protein [Lutibacter agarilyticus]
MKKVIYTILTLMACNFSQAQVKQKMVLDNEFVNPAPENRPRTWMHVMNSNMSKVGLTKDFEAMADAGIGGIILFNVSAYIKDGDEKFNSPEHIDKIGHAAAECERLGLSFGVHNCDGWTSSGGPWVTAEHSMKQIVHREMVVEGGKINLKLPDPTKRGDYYKDVAVIAYPALESEVITSEIKPEVTSSSSDFNIDMVIDGKIDERNWLKVPEKGLSWIQWDFKKPHTVRSFYLNCEKKKENGITKLQMSNDGINFKDVVDFKVLRQGKKEYAIDKHFDAITARYFRFVTDMDFEISEINLTGVYRFNDMLARTSLFMQENHRLPSLDQAPENMIVKKDEIINLTEFVNNNGVLKTKLPNGNWTIMRFGYTITGAVNGPASDEGRGWEVDKMSKASFKTFFDGYVKNVIDVSKPVAPNALQYIEIDSYEVGGQNWTLGYENYFKEHFGYDIMDFLPLYAGRYVENTDTTERVLWDMRNFTSKMMTDNYFDYFTELCHDEGLISYVEPYSFNAAFNELDATKKVDIPMGEFWMRGYFKTETAVSGARIYGKNIVSAEAFTALPKVNWRSHPGQMKLSGDKAWTLGINEFMFHRYAHQANTNVAPGMTMGIWGSHIDRTQTWWDNAGKSWFKYLARGQYMLRKGIPVSDLLVFVGDGTPNSSYKVNSISPKLPDYVNFDCINSDAMINRITVKDHKMVLPNGISYYMLNLKNMKEVKLSTLRKIAELAEKGIIITGDKPEQLGGYNNSLVDKQEFEKLVKLIWSAPNTLKNKPWEEIYNSYNIPKDLVIEDGNDIGYTHRKTENEDIYFFYNPTENEKTFKCTFNVANKIPELWNQLNGEITKVAAFNHNKNGTTITIVKLSSEGSVFVVFRESSNNVTSIQADYALNTPLVQAVLSKENKIEFNISKAGVYNVKLNNGETKTIKVKQISENVDISSNWKVSFPTIKSEQKTFNFSELIDWTTHSNEEIKYFSGTAIYEKSFNINKKVLAKDVKLILDLGKVDIAAKVILNGKDLGVIWKAPYQIDITDAVKKGGNVLKIEITNQWTNRLIGDENYPDLSGYYDSKEMPEWYKNNEPAPLGKRTTFTTYNFFKKGDDLIPAGLVGPIMITFKQYKTIK